MCEGFVRKEGIPHFMCLFLSFFHEGMLKKLTTLKVDDNQLTSLPNTIGRYDSTHTHTHTHLSFSVRCCFGLTVLLCNIASHCVLTLADDWAILSVAFAASPCH